MSNDNSIAVVNLEKCDGCGNCVTACPYDAVNLNRENEKPKAVVKTEKCNGCGTCVPSCWSGSIQLPDTSDKIILEYISQFSKNHSGILVFTCSLYLSTMEGSSTNGKVEELRSNIIKVPCTGAVKPEYVLKALSSGLDGVMILACCEMGCCSAECKYKSANEWMIKRFAIFNKLLDHIGLGSKRVKIDQSASCDPAKYKEILMGFEKHLKELGRNPLVDHMNRGGGSR
jgi:coenzyme F420-reducing hydrogenase delta subunit/NAD-dependent dihydropyrimidine dehydrogenase PreA subunit